MANKIEQIEAEIQEYRDLINDASVPQDEKDFAKGEIEDLEAELAKLKAKSEKPAKEKKSKAEKPAKESATSNCEELEQREEKAKSSGYDIDELLKKAKEQKAKAKARAEAKKDEPQKTPATKNKEAVEKTANKVVTNVEKRADKGNVKASEIEKLIEEYEEAIKKLRKILAELKEEKKAKGGSIKAEKGKKKSVKKKPIVRYYFEESGYSYGDGGKIAWHKKEENENQEGSLELDGKKHNFSVSGKCDPRTGFTDYNIVWKQGVPSSDRNIVRQYEEHIKEIAYERHYAKGGNMSSTCKMKDGSVYKKKMK